MSLLNISIRIENFYSVIRRKNVEGNLSKKTFKGLNIVLFGKVINYISQLIVTMLLARLLDSETFGIISICTMIIGFAQVLCSLGLGPSLVQKKNINDEYIYTALISTLVLGGILYLLSLLTSTLITNFYDIEEYVILYRILCVVFLFNTLSGFGQSLLQRDLNFEFITLCEIISYVIGYCLVGVILSFFGFGVWALAFAIIGQSLIKFLLITNSIIKSYKLKVKKVTFSWITLKEMLNFGVGYSIGHIAAYFSSNGDYLVVGKLLGENILSFYSRAYQLIALPANFLGHALDLVLFPVMSKYQEDKNRLAETYLTSLYIFSIVFIPISIFLFLFADEIILVLLGPNWGAVTKIFKILCFSLFSRMSYKLTDSVTRAIGIVNIRAFLKILYAILIIVFSILGALVDINLVAYFVGIIIVLNYIANNLLLYKYIKFNLFRFIFLHFKGGMIGFLLFLVLNIIKKVTIYYKLGAFLTLIISTLIFGITYILIIVLLSNIILDKNVILFLNVMIPSKMLSKLQLFINKMSLKKN